MCLPWNPGKKSLLDDSLKGHSGSVTTSTVRHGADRCPKEQMRSCHFSLQPFLRYEDGILIPEGLFVYVLRHIQSCIPLPDIWKPSHHRCGEARILTRGTRSSLGLPEQASHSLSFHTEWLKGAIIGVVHEITVTYGLTILRYTAIGKRCEFVLEMRMVRLRFQGAWPSCGIRHADRR